MFNFFKKQEVIKPIPAIEEQCIHDWEIKKIAYCSSICPHTDCPGGPCSIIRELCRECLEWRGQHLYGVWKISNSKLVRDINGWIDWTI